MQRMTVRIVARISAESIESQTPSISRKIGRIKTEPIWKTRVRKNESAAEIAPFPSAVKSDEPKIPKPEKMKESENR